MPPPPPTEIQVPVPSLLREEDGELRPYDPAVGGSDALQWELPVEVRLGAVHNGEGQALTPVEASRFGLIFTRLTASDAPEEVFDDGAGAWAPLADQLTDGRLGEHIEMLPLEYVEDDATHPWHGMGLLADEERYPRSEGPTPLAWPRYLARCYFEADDVARLGPPTHPLPVLDLDPLLASVRWDRAKVPEWVQMYLEDENRRLKADVQIRKSTSPSGISLQTYRSSGAPAARARLSPEGAVELEGMSHDDGRRARLSLGEDGDIRLDPADARRVVIHGELEITRGPGWVRVRSLGGTELRLDGKVVVEGNLEVKGRLAVRDTITYLNGMGHLP